MYYVLRDINGRDVWIQQFFYPTKETNAHHMDCKYDLVVKKIRTNFFFAFNT